MANTIKSRILLKTDTTLNWDKATNFIPKKGEICIYSDRFQLDDGSYVPGIKVGDGSSYIHELEFMGDEYISNEEINEILGIQGGGNSSNAPSLETWTITFPDYDSETYTQIFTNISLTASNSKFSCNTLDSNNNLIRITSSLYDLLTNTHVPTGCTFRSIKIVKDTALILYGGWLSTTFIALPADLYVEELGQNGYTNNGLNSYVPTKNVTLTYDGPI